MLKNTKIFFNKLFFIFILYLVGAANVSYAEKIDISILKEDLTSITRGSGTIGEIELSSALLDVVPEYIPDYSLEILSKIPNSNVKTRGADAKNIYKKFSDSVVLIINKEKNAMGSGSILMKDPGIVLTNWHVANGGKVLGVILKFEGDIKKSSVYPAIIIGYDAVRDLALLGIKGKFPENINQIIPKNSNIEVGSDVHAIGHPKSYAWTYTKGYVSQIRNNFKWKYRETAHEANVIQTQTPIDAGNSGGPLFDQEGFMVGVNSFKASAENVNFAVSSIDVIKFMENIKTNVEPKKNVEKKKKKVLVKKEDTNGDGKPDVFYYDDNNDGIPEVKVIDNNHNGKPDIIAVDTNGDRKPDLLAIDSNEDGTPDRFAIDKDFDGEPDIMGIDTDGDGKPDKFKKWG